MSHSHLPVQHLLKQVETYRARRESRDIRPEWLVDTINDVADLFDPASEVARVGYDCQVDEGRWNVGLYLGRTEFVGGRDDGLSRHAAFSFDVAQLLERFASVESCRWDSGTDEDGQADLMYSFLEVIGFVDINPVCLRIHAIPPSDAGPGFRRFPNGSDAPVE